MIQFAVYYILPVILIFVTYLKYRFSFWRKRGFLTTVPHTPLGDLSDVGREYHLMEKFADLYNKSKKRSGFLGAYMGLSPTLIINDLDMLREILVKDFHNFQDRGVYFNEEVDPLSATLFSIDGEKWQKMRNNLSPTFTSGKMKQMFHTISDKGTDLIKYIKENYACKNEALSAKDVTQRFTAEAIGSCAFGLECNALKSTDMPEILQKSDELFKFTGLAAFYFLFINAFHTLAKFLKCRVFSKSVTDYFMSMIQQTVNYRETNKIHRSDFLNMVMNLKNHGSIYDDKKGDESSKITFNEMCAQSFIFFFAGFETSSTAMTFALYFLAKYPDIQDKVREEVKRIKALHGNEISYDALMEMPYLNQVFNETLRLYPPAGNLVRKALTDYKIPGTKLIIPKDTIVTIPVYGIHHDREIYSKPDEFNPDHFSPEEVQKRHPYAFLPFGEGPRNCIGMRFAQLQSKYGIATIVDNFKLSVNSKTQEPLKLDKVAPGIVVEGGIWLNVEEL